MQDISKILRHKLDLYTKKEMAEAVGIPMATVHYLIKTGRLPNPTRGNSVRKHYSKQDIEEIKLRMN